VPSLSFFADNGWIIGFLIALFLYPVMMKSDSSSLMLDKEFKDMTM
jgi:nucleobase:cation symporter-1, NCS1 family